MFPTISCGYESNIDHSRNEIVYVTTNSPLTFDYIKVGLRKEIDI